MPPVVRQPVVAVFLAQFSTQMVTSPKNCLC